MLDGHARIGGMQAADVLMIETAACPDEDLVQGPLASIFHRCAHGKELLIGKGCGTLALLLGIGAGGVSPPRACRVSVAARGKPFHVARPIALQDLIEFGPIDRSEL